LKWMRVRDRKRHKTMGGEWREHIGSLIWIDVGYLSIGNLINFDYLQLLNNSFWIFCVDSSHEHGETCFDMMTFLDYGLIIWPSRRSFGLNWENHHRNRIGVPDIGFQNSACIWLLTATWIGSPGSSPWAICSGCKKFCIALGHWNDRESWQYIYLLNSQSFCDLMSRWK
jgi:hypothetical protein